MLLAMGKAMRRFLPSLSALHAFDASVRFLSFTRAAESLGLTQSGVSRQIQNLEQFIGLKLFERAGPKLVLTDDGRRYYDDVSRILATLEEATIDAVRGSKARGLLKIGIPPTLMRRWAPSVLARFSKANRECFYEVVPCKHAIDWETSEIDVAIVRGHGNWQNVRSQFLMDETMVVVGAPEVLQKGSLSSDAELLDYPLIQNSSRSSLWLQWLRGADIHLNKRIIGPRLPTMDMIIESAVHGLGLAVVPKIFVRQELASGQLMMALTREQSSGENFYFCISQRNAAAKNVTLFRDWLIADMKKMRTLE